MLGFPSFGDTENFETDGAGETEVVTELRAFQSCYEKKRQSSLPLASRSYVFRIWSHSYFTDWFMSAFSNIFGLQTTKSDPLHSTHP